MVLVRAQAPVPVPVGAPDTLQVGPLNRVALAPQLCQCRCLASKLVRRPPGSERRGVGSFTPPHCLCWTPTRVEMPRRWHTCRGTGVDDRHVTLGFGYGCSRVVVVHRHSYLSHMLGGFDPQDKEHRPKGASYVRMPVPCLWSHFHPLGCACSLFQAAVNTTKLVVGVGSFSLPKAFQYSGMLGGVLGVPLLCVWAAFAMKLMVDVRESLGAGARYFDCGRFVWV